MSHFSNLDKLNLITKEIIGASIQVHKELGPGLLESSYKFCLIEELKNSTYKIEIEKPLPIIYKGLKLKAGYRVDMLIENKIIVEFKSVESLNEVHVAQTLTYMKLAKCKLGLLINFNVALLTNGIRRLIK